MRKIKVSHVFSPMNIQKSGAYSNESAQADVFYNEITQNKWNETSIHPFLKFSLGRVKSDLGD